MYLLNNEVLHQEWLEVLWRNDQEIAQLDPLGADELIQTLPDLNATRDTAAITSLLKQLLPSLAKAQSMSCEEACAAMRDIGLLLGSLKRHGVEPAKAVPELGIILPILGSISNYPPRDTLLHYTIWNPQDERMRTYTGTEDERHLIQSVQMSMPPLEVALHSLLQLLICTIHNPQFITLGKTVAYSLEGLIDGVVHARRKVSPAYFAQELRLYFDPIEINGESFLGPGAVEMPVFVLDHLLWSSDCADQEYNAFKTGYLPYVRPVWRLVYEAYADQPSLISQVLTQLKSGESIQPADLVATKEIVTISNRLKSFRMPHKKLAEEAYAHQNGNQRSQGSGGYETSILSHIIGLMTDKTDLLAATLQQVTKSVNSI